MHGMADCRRIMTGSEEQGIFKNLIKMIFCIASIMRSFDQARDQKVLAWNSLMVMPESSHLAKAPLSPLHNLPQ